jgi:hypothetical protein
VHRWREQIERALDLVGVDAEVDALALPHDEATCL